VSNIGHFAPFQPRSVSHQIEGFFLRKSLIFRVLPRFSALCHSYRQCSEGTPEYVAELLGTLWRSGDSPEITNILHQALLAPTNHYREATFRAYVMASPVPMTVLTETVVKEIPPEERDAWYARSGSKKLKTHSWIDRSIDRPSREALRYSHFLNLIKAIETDPECLRGLGDIVDPKWE